MKDIILYHGSRSGIEGEIQPASREKCDFGKGFYMGESDKQAKGLISEAETPVFYRVKLKLSEIPENRILILDGKEWLNAVIANRRYSEEFSRLDIAKRILSKIRHCDVVIGPIADDRMNEAMSRFTDYALTDQGLIACLKSVDYGMQYVAKTEFACSKIEILDKKILKGKELEDIRQYSTRKRQESRDVVKNMALKYQREGLYLNEIIQRERQKEMEWER